MSIRDRIRVALEQETDFAFRIQFDETDLAPWLGDETAPLGHERGPNPSRILLASIASCLAASLLFAMREFKNDPVGVVAHITATPMRNAGGLWRIPQASMELPVSGGNQDYAQLQRILDQFERFCVVTQSVRQGIDAGPGWRSCYLTVLLSFNRHHPDDARRLRLRCSS